MMAGVFVFEDHDEGEAVLWVCPSKCKWERDGSVFKMR